MNSFMKDQRWNISPKNLWTNLKNRIIIISIGNESSSDEDESSTDGSDSEANVSSETDSE